ncbi:hypothetical protein, partial [Rhizobium sp. RU36D]|uniref:hypothetical protein n=1 Tax=Rhizobium sp. RU36D TaxID=1907415 RepID=UPI001AECA8CF
SASTKLNWPSRRTDIKSPQIAANQLNHISRIWQQSHKGGEDPADNARPSLGYSVRLSACLLTVLEKASGYAQRFSPLVGGEAWSAKPSNRSSESIAMPNAGRAERVYAPN